MDAEEHWLLKLRLPLRWNANGSKAAHCGTVYEIRL